MSINYRVEITNPSTHLVNVTLSFSPDQAIDYEFYLPVWSPGSYMVREYSRHIRWIKVNDDLGKDLFFKQKDKSTWLINLAHKDFPFAGKSIEIRYQIYCKDLTVRTSHVDDSHAFLHGPSYLMGIKGFENLEQNVSVYFPPVWSKISTGLSQVNKKRELFDFVASNYDELIDSPIEIGCHETDGFIAKGIEHHLAFYGDIYPHKNSLKEDIQKIVETCIDWFGEVPFLKYQFIFHFVPKTYGGLEHSNSTAIQFDGRKLNCRKEYLKFLSLVAHEYFHSWNIKRIRPVELGPFDYSKENYTSLLWLAEGLTSFIDNLTVLVAQKASLDEYLQMLLSDLKIYHETPGKKFHSLETSSFNAWIKLYRPDENSKNSTMSYYLKGGLVFLVLHSQLCQQQKSIRHFLKELWSHYKADSKVGITKQEIMNIVLKLGGENVLASFSDMIETTYDLPLEQAFSQLGLELVYEQSTDPWLGVDFEMKGERVFIKHVLLDGPAYKSGLNAGDELIAINGLRIISEDMGQFNQWFQVDMNYKLVVARLNKLVELSISFENESKKIKQIKILNNQKAMSMLLS